MADADFEAFLDRLQSERAEWGLRNFGPRPSHSPLRGIVEEVGEMCDAIRVWEEGENRSYAALLIALSDAVGDVFVFAAAYCESRKWQLSAVYRDTSPSYDRPVSVLHLLNLVSATGRLCHHDLKSEEGIRRSEDHDARGKEALATVLRFVRGVAKHWPIDVPRVVEQTWDEVKKRDYRKEREDGERS